MKKVLIGLGIFLAILIVLLGGLGGCYISIKNGLIQQEEDVTAQWAQVENQLKRRSDLIPNLVETVKGFSVHEKEVIASVTEARAKLAGSQSAAPAERAKLEGELSNAISRLLVVVENYPTLKSDTHYIALMDELAGTENRIAVARKDYNNAVRAFNTKIKQFPGSLFGFEKREYFEIEEKDKEVPKVKF